MASPVRLTGGPRGFVQGISMVLWGLKRMLEDAALRKDALAPLVLTGVLYVLGFGALAYFSADLLALVWQRPEEGAGRWLWLLLLPLMLALAFVLFALLFGTVAELVGGPFWDRLAMRVLRAHGLAAKEPGLLAGTLPDLVRSLLFLGASLLCAMLAPIPVIGLLFAALGSLIAWVGLAASAVNPALMCTGFTLRDRLRFIGRSIAPLAGVGMVVGLAMMVPLLGLLAIPSAVIGATELYARARAA